MWGLVVLNSLIKNIKKILYLIKSFFKGLSFSVGLLLKILIAVLLAFIFAKVVFKWDLI